MHDHDHTYLDALNAAAAAGYFGPYVSGPPVSECIQTLLNVPVTDLFVDWRWVDDRPVFRCYLCPGRW